MNTSKNEATKIPLEVLEHREKKKYLRSESKFFNQGNPFNALINEKQLIKYVMELLMKSN